MRSDSKNHYEKAFKSWLIENDAKHFSVDQTRRATHARSKIKSFDFLLYPNTSEIIIAEVKGRTFKGETLAGLKGLANWVTIEDIKGMIRWEDIMGDGHKAYFIFAYSLKNIFVDSDGLEIFEHDGKRYVFYCISIDDYQKYMKPRSEKWQTVCLSASNFRDSIKPAKELLLRQDRLLI